VTEPADRDLLELQRRAFTAITDRLESSDARAAERHRALMERQLRGERIFVEAIGDIDQSIQRNTDRLDDMGEAIRANTRAVLSVLDRIEPHSD
jgi:hypothetical protein